MSPTEAPHSGQTMLVTSMLAGSFAAIPLLAGVLWIVLYVVLKSACPSCLERVQPSIMRLQQLSLMDWCAVGLYLAYSASFAIPATRTRRSTASCRTRFFRYLAAATSLAVAGWLAARIAEAHLVLPPDASPAVTAVLLMLLAVHVWGVVFLVEQQSRYYSRAAELGDHAQDDCLVPPTQRHNKSEPAESGGLPYARFIGVLATGIAAFPLLSDLEMAMASPDSLCPGGYPSQVGIVYIVMALAGTMLFVGALGKSARRR